MFIFQAQGGSGNSYSGGGSGGRLAVEVTEEDFDGVYIISGGDGGIVNDRSIGRGAAGTAYIHRKENIDDAGKVIIEEKETLIIKNKDSSEWRSGRPDVNKPTQNPLIILNYV